MSFPPPAESQMNESLDLNSLCIQHPAATFFMRLTENIPANDLRTGDMLVVDRSVQPHPHALVVAILDGEFVVRGYEEVACVTETEMWGVVVSVVRTFV